MTAIQRHAFLIMAHDDFELLAQLIGVLDDERAEIFVHVDKRIGDYPQARLRAAAKTSRIHFIPRVAVRWSGYSQVTAELALLEAASDIGFDYYHLLSGHDLPIARRRDFYDFFIAHKGKEFVDCWGPLDQGGDAILANGLPAEHYLKRLRYFYPFEPSHRASRVARAVKWGLVRVQRGLGVNRVRRSSLPFCYGANWFSITHGLARYVLDQRTLIARTFRWTSSPDEIFLQTVLLDSAHRNDLFQTSDGGIQQNLRQVEWARPGEYEYSPYVFRIDDVEALLRSENLFARKFDSRVDAVAIAKIIDFVRSE